MEEATAMNNAIQHMRAVFDDVRATKSGVTNEWVEIANEALDPEFITMLAEAMVWQMTVSEFYNLCEEHMERRR